MNMQRTVIGGLVGGVVGAAVWVAMAYFAGFGSRWGACVVGLFAGIGVRSATANTGSPLAGLVAAAVALVAVLGGKFAVANLQTESNLSAYGVFKSDPADYTRAEAVAHMCSDLVAKYEAQGRTFEWPDGVDPDDVYMAEQYPEPILNEAVETWDRMSSSEQERYKVAMHRAIVAKARGSGGDAEGSPFLASFSIFDVLWFGLAFTTAFKVASRRDGPSAEKTPEQPASVEPPAGAGFWGRQTEPQDLRKSA